MHIMPVAPNGGTTQPVQKSVMFASSKKNRRFMDPSSEEWWRTRRRCHRKSHRLVSCASFTGSSGCAGFDDIGRDDLQNRHNVASRKLEGWLFDYDLASASPVASHGLQQAPFDSVFSGEDQAMLEIPIKKKKPKAGLLAVIAAFGVAGLLMASSVLNSSGSPEGPVNELLVEAAKSLNAQLPAMVDKHTRLEATSVLPGDKFLYEYTIVGMDRMPRRDQIVRETRPRITKGYRTATDLQEMRDRDITLVCSYSDESGNEVVRYEVGPEDL